MMQSNVPPVKKWLRNGATGHTLGDYRRITQPLQYRESLREHRREEERARMKEESRKRNAGRRSFIFTL